MPSSPLQGSMSEQANEVTHVVQIMAAAGDRGGSRPAYCPHGGGATVKRKGYLLAGQPSAAQQCQVKYDYNLKANAR